MSKFQSLLNGKQPHGRYYLATLASGAHDRVRMHTLDIIPGECEFIEVIFSPWRSQTDNEPYDKTVYLDDRTLHFHYDKFVSMRVEYADRRCGKFVCRYIPGIR